MGRKEGDDLEEAGAAVEEEQEEEEGNVENEEHVGQKENSPIESREDNQGSAKGKTHFLDIIF